jgi:phage recombination protein Bet
MSETAKAQARTQGQTQTVEETDSTWARLMDRDLKFRTEFVPFHATDKIVLSPQIVIRYFCKQTAKGFVCTEEFATRFIMICKARGLNPWEGDAYLVGFDGKDGPEFNIITAHQAFLKRGEVHPAFTGMESGVSIIEDGGDAIIQDIQGDLVPPGCNLVGGWARVFRSDREHQVYRRLALESYDKQRSVWNSNKSGMIVKCAEADALRSAFPNSLAGMYTPEELPGGEQRIATDAEPAKRMSLRGRNAPQQPSPSPEGGASPPRQAPPLENTTAGSESVKDPGGSTLPAQPAPTVPSNPAGGAGPTSAPAPGKGRPKAVVKHCPACGWAMAGGKCPNEANHGQAAAETGTGRPDADVDSADVPNGGNPLPSAPPTVNIAGIRSALKVATVSTIAATKLSAISAREHAGIELIDDATDEQIQDAYAMFVELKASVKK